MRYSNHQKVNIMIVNTWDTWFDRPQIGRGPWLKLPVCNVGDRGFKPHSGLQETKCFSPSLIKIQYFVEPPWPRGSVLGLRPPGLEFWSLCLEGSVISFISPSSGGSPGLYVQKSVLKPHSFIFHLDTRWLIKETSSYQKFFIGDML